MERPVVEVDQRRVARRGIEPRGVQQAVDRRLRIDAAGIIEDQFSGLDGGGTTAASTGLKAPVQPADESTRSSTPPLTVVRPV